MNASPGFFVGMSQASRRVRPQKKNNLMNEEEKRERRERTRGVQPMHIPARGSLPKVINDDVGARGDIRRHPRRGRLILGRNG